jgi:hypothetical protein
MHGAHHGRASKSPQWVEALAGLSAAKDRPEATSWLARVKGDPAAARSDKDEMQRCEAMARPIEMSRTRCPFAAQEAWPNAEFEKYCR